MFYIYSAVIITLQITTGLIVMHIWHVGLC